MTNTKGKPLIVPPLPTAANASAFLRSGQEVADHLPRNEEDVHPITVKVPLAWKQRLAMKKAETGRSFQEVGFEAFKAFLKS